MADNRPKARLFGEDPPKVGGDTGQSADRRLEEAKDLLKIIDKELSWAMPRVAILQHKDIEFLDDMRGKIRQYGRGAQISGRQLFWLRDIKDRLVG